MTTKINMKTLLFFLCFAILFSLPLAVLAGQDDSAAVNELKQKAQDAFIKGHYAEAADADLEIAEKYPESRARHYAVQMLGTIYENNVVDIKKSIKWYREYLKKYADQRQAPFYTEKIASLEKLLNQEQSFKAYQAIRYAGLDDSTMVKKFEDLLKEHPDFLLKDKVERELAYAYARMDKRKESEQAFQALSNVEGKKLSSSDQIASERAKLYWQMTSVGAWVAWALIIMLWAAVLLMNPWKQLTKTSIRNFLFLAVAWVLLTAAGMPFFYHINTDADQYVLHDTIVYTAVGLNLTILIWLLLLTRGQFWQNRPRTLRWVAPVLTVLMTTAVFYLVIIYCPNGPDIMDVFTDKYEHWMAVGQIN
jgi:tetratricopeptide (TPR) repeat protein